MSKTQKTALLIAATIGAVLLLARRNATAGASSGDTLGNVYNQPGSTSQGNIVINNNLTMPPLPANPNSFTYLFETTNPGVPDINVLFGNPWATGADGKMQYIPLFGLIPISGN